MSSNDRDDGGWPPEYERHVGNAEAYARAEADEDPPERLIEVAKVHAILALAEAIRLHGRS